MEKWLFDSLARVLGEEVSEDLSRYILEVDSKVDFEDYMKGLLDFSNKSQKRLYDDIIAAKFGPKSRSQNKTTANNNINFTPVKPPLQESNCNSAGSTSSDSGGKKKSKKYRKFQLSELHQGYLKEGRNPCDCQATKHRLINNCIECGRIVCEQEGSGPCFFCDNMVCTREELEVLNSETKQADVLYRTLTERKKSDTWKKAIQSRNKLLEYDKDVAQLTKIIDDEHDYFEVNNRWNSKKEREKASKKLEQVQELKHGSRLGAHRIVLDILGKQVYEDTNYIYNNDEEDEDEVNQDEDRKYVYRPTMPDVDTVLKALKNDKANFKDKKLGVIDNDSTNSKFMKSNYIIQDKSFLEMTDKGMCLSMHQPWATLLVLGIKKHEGRTWYTPHRGTLWIASTSKPVDPDTVKECETFYKKYYDGLTIRFPDKYPTGSLVGNVLLQDCISQDEYREQFPNGESECPYVWICSDPNKLIVPIPMKGEHKIYKLNSEIHVMARDALILKKRFAK